jgi:hypothetical protein
VGKYLNIDDLRCTRPKILRMRAVRMETIDGWPMLVIYFRGDKRGLPLTRELANEFAKALGPIPYAVEEFFKSQERQRH